jgi:hypothetical protein
MVVLKYIPKHNRKVVKTKNSKNAPNFKLIFERLQAAGFDSLSKPLSESRFKLISRLYFKIIFGIKKLISGSLCDTIDAAINLISGGFNVS